LRLVENDDLGPEGAVEVNGVYNDLLVVHHGEELGASVLRKPRVTRAGDQQSSGATEAGDLFLPLTLQRRGTHHEHTRNAIEPAQQFDCGDRLDGLTQSHIVGEQRALAECEMQHPLALVGQQRMTQHVDHLPPGGDFG